jgi:Fur family ferric uptake transcriptional regulator
MSHSRTTRQRSAVREVLAESHEFRSAQDLHAELLNREETISLATVYRTLSMLHEKTEIDQLVTEDGEARYRRCSGGHHHHLVCRSCGRTVEIEEPAPEEWAARVADLHGFSEIAHTIELSGLCPSCAGS